MFCDGSAEINVPRACNFFLHMGQLLFALIIKLGTNDAVGTGKFIAGSEEKGAG